MLTRDDLLAVLARIPVQAPVRSDEVTGSTNATARAMAEDGAPEWSLVAAGHQTEGRGRTGRTWEDMPGESLLVSVVLRPTLPPPRAGLLALLAGAEMALAIRDVSGKKVVCKWPNDLLLDDRKVGGILLESSIVEGRLRYAILGVGVNRSAPPGVEGAGGVGPVNLRSLLGAFLERFVRVYGAGEPSWEERVKNEWLPVSETVGRLVEATTTDGSVVRGRASGIDDFGGLRLSVDTGELTVAFGEIRHLGTA